MIGRNPRSFDENKPVLAHDEWRGSTREISSCNHRGRNQNIFWGNRKIRIFNFLKLTFPDFGVPDLPDLGQLLVGLEPLWSSLCTQSELISSWNHQLTSGFRLSSCILSVLRLGGRNLRPDAGNMWESFYFQYDVISDLDLRG